MSEKMTLFQFISKYEPTSEELAMAFEKGILIDDPIYTEKQLVDTEAKPIRLGLMRFFDIGLFGEISIYRLDK